MRLNATGALAVVSTVVWRRLSFENSTFFAAVYDLKTLHTRTERNCPATMRDGPSIVRSLFSQLVFLSGTELPHWLMLTHS